MRPEFTTLATAGVGPFLTGDVASPYQVSTSGSAGINILQGNAELSAFLAAAENRFRAEAFSGSHILERDIAHPAARFGHDNDGGGGRLIPGLSIEQFADPLGQWWGLTADETAAALPNLRNFNDAGLELFN